MLDLTSYKLQGLRFFDSGISIFAFSHFRILFLNQVSAIKDSRFENELTHHFIHIFSLKKFSLGNLHLENINIMLWLIIWRMIYGRL